MGKKILTVDDDRNIVRLIKMNLERAGYQVSFALDGREALERIARDMPDLVVLDFMMPNMGGLETLRHIRANPKTNSLPVIMLTAQTSDQDVFKGYSYGADVYLTKPVNINVLLEYISQVFSDKQAEEDDEDVYKV